jgi:hypothetical protein
MIDEKRVISGMAESKKEKRIESVQGVREIQKGDSKAGEQSHIHSRRSYTNRLNHRNHYAMSNVRPAILFIPVTVREIITLLDRGQVSFLRDQYRLEENRMVFSSRLREDYSGDLASGRVQG